MAAASDEIDRRLARDPNVVGEVLFDTVRRLRVTPLVVDYEVNDDDRLVIVISFQSDEKIED